MNINFITKLPSKHDGIQPELWRDDKGRLKIVAPFGCDLFDLLRWVDENPLTQLRVMGDGATSNAALGLNQPSITSPAFEPPDCFKHLFENGKPL